MPILIKSFTIKTVFLSLKISALAAKEKIYFASDFHLGVPDYESSLVREKKVVAWLDSVKHDAAEIYLVGDIFDFWFEYKYTIPKGFVRLLGKIAEITDSGTTVHVFTGNHDMWMFGYLEKEDRKSTRLNSSHIQKSRMPSSA